MNCVILQGRLTRDPEIKVLSETSTVTNFTIVTSRYYVKNDEKIEEATFTDCEVWGKQAEAIASYVKKGDSLLVRGSLKNHNYEKDGVKVYRTRVKVLEFDFLTKKDTSSAAPQKDAPDPESKVNKEEVPF